MNIEVLYAGKENCKSEHCFGPAIRPHYLIHFILKGKGIYKVNNKTYYLSEGQAFLIKPGEVTCYQADSQDPWTYAWIGISGQSVRDILNVCDFTHNGYIYTGINENIKNCLLKMVDLFCEYEKNQLEIYSLLYQIFASFNKKDTKTKSMTDKIYLKKMCEYIHNNYTYPIKISSIASYIGIDRSYLYKIMRDNMDISPQQYLIDYRLSCAEDMLENTQMTVTEIAYSCGFKDAPSFCRIFKIKKGVTPKQYKNKIMFKEEV